MRLRVLSDLHLELGPFEPPPVKADAVVLAGDIGTGVHGVAWARNRFPGVPVVYVPGNHEYYGAKLSGLVPKMQEAALGCDVRVLSDASVLVSGVRFLAATLWTDFRLFGNPLLAETEARDRMNDFRRIRVGSDYRKLRPSDTIRAHNEAVRWLTRELSGPADGPVVVVTHHAPSLRSIKPTLQREQLSAAFASHLDELVANSGAALWVHGHTHWNVDYRIGATRVVTNQRGYPGEETEGFRADLSIEV